MRIWCRETLQLRALLAFPQWIDCVAPRGSNLLVAAGPTLYMHR